MRLPKRKPRYKSRYMPTRRERWREFWGRVNEEEGSHSTFGEFGGMGLGGPAPPVDPSWEHAQREAEKMEQKASRGE